jgi:polyisoprenoid-binding protein YceI
MKKQVSTWFLSLVVLAGVGVVGPAEATTKSSPKPGSKCSKVNAKSGELVCLKKAGRLVWSRIVVVSAGPPSSGTSPTSTLKPTATTSASAAQDVGIDGTWKATSKSEVNYRAKEVLLGQDTEGVGKTNAVTGTLTIAGSKVTAVELEADLTTLKSNSSRRDTQVQDRILETAKFPKAIFKLSAPIDFGTAPGDREQIKAKASASLTLHGTTKSIAFDVVARRNGPAIEVNGAIPITFADFGIADPSLANVATVEPTGLIEFLIVFER